MNQLISLFELLNFLYVFRSLEKSTSIYLCGSNFLSICRHFWGQKNSLRQFVWEGIKEPVWHARANKFLIFLAYIHAVNGGVSAIYAFLMVGQEDKKTHCEDIIRRILNFDSNGILVLLCRTKFVSPRCLSFLLH